MTSSRSGILVVNNKGIKSMRSTSIREICCNRCVDTCHLETTVLSLCDALREQFKGLTLYRRIYIFVTTLCFCGSINSGRKRKRVECAFAVLRTGPSFPNISHPVHRETSSTVHSTAVPSKKITKIALPVPVLLWPWTSRHGAKTTCK